MNNYKIHLHKRITNSLLLVVLMSVLISACAQSETKTDQGKIKVVASTTIVGEFVRQVGGEYIDLVILMPAGADPHTFEPRPQDIAAISEAKIVFINGFGLEESITPILDANLNGVLIEVSENVEKLDLEESDSGHQDDIHNGWDPHTWMDPINVIQWVDTIDQSLSQLDPTHSDYYHTNASAARTSLNELDRWIQDQVSKIPPDRRKLVSDHAFFGYFARRYGFDQTGMVTKSFSTNASPSALELTELQEEIRKAAAPAIFINNTSNPKIAEQIARDLGVQIVQIYAGSLSQPGGDADTYKKYMRYNVARIVDALK